MARLNARLDALEHRHGRDDAPHRGRVILYHLDRPTPVADCCGPIIYLPCKRDGQGACSICAEEVAR